MNAIQAVDVAIKKAGDGAARVKSRGGRVTLGWLRDSMREMPSAFSGEWEVFGGILRNKTKDVAYRFCLCGPGPCKCSCSE